MACLRSWFMGLISAWLPSRRSTEHHVGALVMTLSGHVRSRRPTGGNGRYFSKGIVFALTGVAMVRDPRFAVWSVDPSGWVGLGSGRSSAASIRRRFDVWADEGVGPEKQRNLPARGRRRFRRAASRGARLLEKEQAQVRTAGHRLPTIAAHDRAKSRFRAAARDAAAEVDWVAVGEVVRAHLARWLVARPPTTVVVYLALPDEVPVEALSLRPELGRHRWAVTRTGSRGGLDLSLHPLASARERHRHGYQQPVPGSALVVDDEVGLVLVPGLAFDRGGGRLGRGKGYYDRLLARLGPGVERVGVTAEALVAPEPVPVDDHDVAMGWLVTEAGVRRVDPLPSRGG